MPVRSAGPSLEQIVAKVTARKQQALQEAGGIAANVNAALKEYLLAHSNIITPAYRHAFSQLQNVTPTRAPANTPRSILKAGASSVRKPLPSSVSWSSETRLPALSPLRFCVPRPAPRRAIVYETARPSYPLHLLEQSRHDAGGAGRASPVASSLARADADQPSASDGSRDRSAYAARYLAGLPPPPSLARTGNPVCTALELAPSSSASSIASAASAASATEAPEAHMRLRADAPEFVPGPVRERVGVPAGGRADERPRPTGPEPGCGGAGNALPGADATS